MDAAQALYEKPLVGQVEITASCSIRRQSMPPHDDGKTALDVPSSKGMAWSSKCLRNAASEP